MTWPTTDDEMKENERISEHLFQIKLVQNIMGQISPKEGISNDNFVKILDSMEDIAIRKIMMHRNVRITQTMLKQAKEAISECDEAAIEDIFTHILRVSPFHVEARLLLKDSLNQVSSRCAERLTRLFNRTAIRSLGYFSAVQFKTPLTIFHSPDGERIFVSDFFGRVIHTLNATGNSIQTISLGENSMPMGLFPSKDGKGFWCCDYGLNTLFLMNYKGEVVRSIAVPEVRDNAAPSIGITWNDRLVITLRDRPLQALTGTIVSIDPKNPADIFFFEWPEGLLPNALAVVGDQILAATHRPVRMYGFNSSGESCKCKYTASMPSDLRWMTTRGDRLFVSSGRFIFKFSSDGKIEYEVDLAELFGVSEMTPTGFAFSPIDPTHCLILDHLTGQIYSLVLT